MKDSEFVEKDPITGRKLYNRLNSKKLSDDDFDDMFLDESMLGGVL